MRMGLFRKQHFGVTSKVVKVLLMGWESEYVQEMVNNEYRRELAYLVAVVVI